MKRLILLMSVFMLTVMPIQAEAETVPGFWDDHHFDIGAFHADYYYSHQDIYTVGQAVALKMKVTRSRGDGSITTEVEWSDSLEYVPVASYTEQTQRVDGEKEVVTVRLNEIMTSSNKAVIRGANFSDVEAMVLFRICKEKNGTVWVRTLHNGMVVEEHKIPVIVSGSGGSYRYGGMERAIMLTYSVSGYGEFSMSEAERLITQFNALPGAEIRTEGNISPQINEFIRVPYEMLKQEASWARADRIIPLTGSPRETGTVTMIHPISFSAISDGYYDGLNARVGYTTDTTFLGLTNLKGSDNPAHVAEAPATGSYLYDTANPADSLSLPYDLLKTVDTPEQAVGVVTDAIKNLPLDQKKLPAVRELVLQYAEEAVSQGAAVKCGKDTAFGLKDLQNTDDTLQRLSKEASTVLESAGLAIVRPMKPTLVLKPEGDASATVVLQPDVTALKASRLSVQLPQGAILLDLRQLEPDLKAGNLEIGLETQPITGWVAAQGTAGLDNPTGERLKVTLNRQQLHGNMLVRVPRANGDTDYQAVFLQGGSNLGGVYHPASDTMTARINGSGTYYARANTVDFTDILTKSKEMQTAIRFLAAKGILSGTDGRKFAPDQAISRAEIASILLKSLGRLKPDADGGFTDVSSKDWYFGACGSAKAANIMQGYPDGTFRARVVIPKEQIVAIAGNTLIREMGYNLPEQPEAWLSYKDRTSISAWASGTVALASRENLVVLRSDGRFGPGENMTRGDAAILLKRLYERLF